MVAHSIMLRSPIGEIWLKEENDRITQLLFTKPLAIGTPTDLLGEAKDQLIAYFNGKLKAFDLPIEPKGTELQKKIWAAINRIPYGGTTTYGELAEQFGGRSHARAIGAACGANPLPIIIPCHRVIAGNGTLTGYIGGLDRKRSLLRLEAASGHNELFPIAADTFAF